MNIYKINSDTILDDEFVVAETITEAIRLYIDRYASKYMTEKNITKVERTAKKCLISDK